MTRRTHSGTPTQKSSELHPADGRVLLVWPVEGRLAAAARPAEARGDGLDPFSHLIAIARVDEAEADDADSHGGEAEEADEEGECRVRDEGDDLVGGTPRVDE